MGVMDMTEEPRFDPELDSTNDNGQVFCNQRTRPGVQTIPADRWPSNPSHKPWYTASYRRIEPANLGGPYSWPNAPIVARHCFEAEDDDAAERRAERIAREFGYALVSVVPAVTTSVDVH